MRCFKPLSTALRPGAYVHECGFEFTITEPHPDADSCLKCDRKRIEHVADMIYRDGDGTCFEFDHLEVT